MHFKQKTLFLLCVFIFYVRLYHVDGQRKNIRMKHWWWNCTDRWRLYSKKGLSQCHFVHYIPHRPPWNWTQGSLVSCQWKAAYLHCKVQQKDLSVPHSQIRCQNSSWLAFDKKYDSLVWVVKLTASIFCTMSWKAGCVRNGSNTCFLYRSV